MLDAMSLLRFECGPELEKRAKRDARFVARAFLPDYARLATGELAPSPGHVVPGALLRAPNRDEAGVAAGFPAGAERPVVALTIDGGAHRASAMFRERRHPALVTACQGSLPTRVFVYGTLRSGEERHSAMRRPGLRRALEAEVLGCLMDFGDYPGLVLSHGERTPVRGELYEYEDPRDLLRELDEIEDFFGYESEGSLYRRSLLDVATPEGPAIAWVYVYVGDVSGARILGAGDWKRRR